MYSSHSSIHNLKLGCWNINGLSQDKLSDDLFKQFVDSLDLCFFIETFQTDFSHNIYNNYTFHKSAHRISKKGRPMGGIIITMKESLRNSIKIIESTGKHMVWLELNSTHFGLEKPLYICIIYIPPYESNIYGDDKYVIHDMLENYIVKYGSIGNILIMGDLNGRTGVRNDLLELYKLDDLCEFEDINLYENIIYHRMNSDLQTNSFGNRLLDLCKHSKMVILNGRAFGDLQGQTTCFKYNGSSVVDYGICSPQLYKHINYFSVGEPNHLSDHAPLILRLNVTTNNNRINNGSKEESNPSTSMPLGFKWSDTHAQIFKDALNLPPIKEKLKYLLDYTVDTQQQDSEVDHLCEHLTDILIQAGSLSLTRNKKFKPAMLKNKWFNLDLQELKKKVLNLGKAVRKDPCNPFIYQQFIKEKKYFKSRCRSTKYKYINGISQEIERKCIKNDKSFWKLLKSLNKSESHNECPTDEDLFRYFKKLHSLPTVGSDMNGANRKINIQVKERIQKFNSDKYQSSFNEISSEEIEVAVKTLKSGKAYGLDLISNEMIIHSCSVIKPQMKKLFNAMLSSGHYPNSWGNGYIVPIYKKGDSSYPKNYRGITISSCLGKVFSVILNNHIFFLFTTFLFKFH